MSHVLVGRAIKGCDSARSKFAQWTYLYRFMVDDLRCFEYVLYMNLYVINERRYLDTTRTLMGQIPSSPMQYPPALSAH